MSTKYKIQVKPDHERTQAISEQMDATTKAIESWDIYEGKPEPLKVITIPLGLPLYRMANGRTQTDQMAYISEAGVEADFFSANEGNVSAQQAQHTILSRFSKDVSGSITPIYDELERAGQTEPILITRSGVVVNGNRRLAAMRELYEEGHTKFAQIDCAVLPPLTPDQIDEIEDRLQMRPETKLPYTWINEALRIRKRMEATGGKVDALVGVMRRSKADIQKALSALDYADIYLKDWKKAPRDYRLVAEGRQFFPDLASRMKGKDGALREANLRMAWILFDNRGNLGSRIYDFNRIIGEKAADVLNKLSERVVVDEGDEEEMPAAANPTSDLEIDFGFEEAAPDPLVPLIAVLDDEERRDEVAEELKQVCQIVIDLGKATKIGNSALVAVRDANTRLTEADLTKADPKTYAGIEKQLGELIHRAEDMQAKLKAIMEGSAHNEGDA